MSLQVLVATMNQNDYGLIETMNINSDAIIINQSNRNEFEKVDYNGNKINFLSLNERGVGLSRNNALMRATSDICLFADDDVTYIDCYDKIIISSFKENPNADVILFNVPSNNPDRPTYTIDKYSRVRWYNCQRYGAVKIAARTVKLKQANIYFSLLFGGGAKYSSGEDSLFISDCIRKGLKVYANPEIIGYVDQQSSSWFEGYTDKYFFDKGVFYACLSKRWAKLIILQDILRHNKKWKDQISISKAYKLMQQGLLEIN